MVLGIELRIADDISYRIQLDTDILLDRFVRVAAGGQSKETCKCQKCDSFHFHLLFVKNLYTDVAVPYIISMILESEIA